MTLECRVAISPTPSFCNQVLLLAASLRRFHPDSIVRAYVGHPLPMSREHILVEDAFTGHRINVSWVVGKDFTAWEDTRAPYLGTMNARWDTERLQGDTLIISDADTIFTGTLDDVLCRDAVQGVQAHVPPLSNDQFRYLFRICEAPEASCRTSYTGAGFMAAPDAAGPAYPNSGFILLPKQHFEAMIPHYHFAVHRMRMAMSDYYWVDQLSVAVALAKSGVPYHPLTIKFNFPNQREFEDCFPDDLKDIRVVHYLRETLTNRTRDFESLSALHRLVSRTDLTGSHEILRRAVATNLRALEPPALSRAEDAPWA